MDKWLHRNGATEIKVDRITKYNIIPIIWFDGSSRNLEEEKFRGNFHNIISLYIVSPSFIFETFKRESKIILFLFFFFGKIEKLYIYIYISFRYCVTHEMVKIKINRKGGRWQFKPISHSFGWYTHNITNYVANVNWIPW